MERDEQGNERYDLSDLLEEDQVNTPEAIAWLMATMGSVGS